MARVTVEDCSEFVSNPFELVLLATDRSRKISSGAPLLVSRDNDKNPVVALREIGDGLLDIQALRESVVASYCLFQKIEAHEEELEELLDQELASTQYITEHLFDRPDAKNTVQAAEVEDEESALDLDEGLESDLDPLESEEDLFHETGSE